MQQIFTFFFLILIYSTSIATNCYNGRYKQKVFNEFTVTNDIKYAYKQRSDGAWLNLKYDVYQPKNDTAQNRPLIFLAHGSGFLEIPLLDKKSPDIVELAIDLTLKGYVVVSVDYRHEPNPLSFFSEESMIKAVGRGVIDVRDAMCRIMDTTFNYGNPYKIDPNKVIMGGVSGGAISLMLGAFIDNLDGLPMQYKQWILDVEPNAQALLENKYCGSTILGIVNISGAVLDTAWIKEGKGYPPLMSQHGTADPIVPFNFGKPFNIPTLPNLMGSYLIDKRYKNLGQRSELETWISYSHVPFVGGFNLDAIFGPNPFAIVFNPFVLDSTKRHITNFCYSLIDCDALTTTIKQHLVDGNMSIFPNPSNGNFSINIPKENRFEKWNIEAYDISGKQVFQQNNLQHTETIHVQENLGKGLYFIKLYFDRNNERFFYLGKVSIF